MPQEIKDNASYMRNVPAMICKLRNEIIDLTVKAESLERGMKHIGAIEMGRYVDLSDEIAHHYRSTIEIYHEIIINMKSKNSEIL